MQAAKAPPSSEQENDDPASSAENEKLAPVAVVLAGGPDEIVVTGGLVSGGVYVQVTVAGTPRFPARSVPRTEKLCCPGARPSSATGLVHAWNAPPSRWSPRSTTSQPPARS